MPEAISDETKIDGKNARHALLPKRLDDLRRWVEMELQLPEDDQVPMARLDAICRQHLGEFTQRAGRRARRDVQFKVMQETAKAVKS